MARISGIDLPREKKIKYALCYIYGIGQTIASKVLEDAKVNPDIRVKDLKNSEATSIREVVSKLKVEGELRTENTMNIKRLMDIASYRGLRHRRSLPVRGQNTKNNSRTRKGKKKTVAGKKKATM